MELTIEEGSVRIGDLSFDLREIEAILEPHGSAFGDVAALSAYLEKLDPGLLGLLAQLLRGIAPAVSSFLQTVVQVRGEASGPVTDWIERHEWNEGTASSVTVKPLSVERVASLLGADGPLGRILPGYEPRPSQVEVLRRMVAALNQSRHLCLEAPTGTGKSLAYLIPAAAWSMQNHERVLIATHTHALQEQLLGKDLVTLQQLLDRPVRATVLKGRANYICLRKWEEAVEAIGFQSTEAEVEFLAHITAWLGQTSTGDKAEVLRKRSDAQQWEAVASETATCIGPKCKWYASHCFAHRVRREAAQADLLITNHALLCAQLRRGNQGFPAFQRVIIDEAHQLEAVATAAFTAACSLDQLQMSLNRLNSNLSPEAPAKGYLATLALRVGRPFTPVMGGLSFPPGKDLFDLLGNAVVDARRYAGEVQSHLQESAALQLDRRPDLAAALERLMRCVAVLAIGLREVMAELQDRGEEGAAAELRGRLQPLEDAAQALAEMRTPGADRVVWAETEKETVLKVAPLYPADQLRERLFDAYPTVALVSATLAVGGSFDYTLKALGLHAERVDTATVDSPFAWKEQALLLALDDAPVPRDPTSPAYLQRLTDTLREIIITVGGQCVVLFTANAVLQEMLLRLKPVLAAQGIEALGQGIDGTPSLLISRLKSASNVVVFGSGSFWEGIDVPGDALSCLVITRLPFRPPDSPVAAARAQRERSLGLDPFATLALPEAVIRFRQGFGRLIRTRTDRGVVIVLDSRILPENSSYGGVFLASLPPVSRIKGSLATVLRRTRGWIRPEADGPTG
ncbi:MAG: ATP-dependent DNA helicase [Mycobacterium leprae]